MKILRLEEMKWRVQVHMAARSADKTSKNREYGPRAWVLPWPDIASSSHYLNEVYLCLPCLSSALDSEQLEAKFLAITVHTMLLTCTRSPLPTQDLVQVRSIVINPETPEKNLPDGPKLLPFILCTSAHWSTPRSKFEENEFHFEGDSSSVFGVTFIIIF